MKSFKPLFVIFLAGLCLSGISRKAFAKCNPSGNDVCGVRLVAVNKTTTSIETASFLLSTPWPGHTFDNIAANCLQKAFINSPTGSPIPPPKKISVLFCNGKDCAKCSYSPSASSTYYPITAVLTKTPSKGTCKDCCELTTDQE